MEDRDYYFFYDAAAAGYCELTPLLSKTAVKNVLWIFFPFFSGRKKKTLRGFTPVRKPELPASLLAF